MVTVDMNDDRRNDFYLSIFIHEHYHTLYAITLFRFCAVFVPRYLETHQAMIYDS